MMCTTILADFVLGGCSLFTDKAQEIVESQKAQGEAVKHLLISSPHFEGVIHSYPDKR